MLTFICSLIGSYFGGFLFVVSFATFSYGRRFLFKKLSTVAALLAEDDTELMGGVAMQSTRWVLTRWLVRFNDGVRPQWHFWDLDMHMLQTDV